MEAKIQQIQEQIKLMNNQFFVVNVTEGHLDNLRTGINSAKELLFRVETELDFCINSLSVLKDGFEAVHANISKVIES